jgi:hypothetical protein
VKYRQIGEDGGLHIADLEPVMLWAREDFRAGLTGGDPIRDRER